ncbi:MAG: hypothetical protein QOI20_440 [Acidimicrobiaceae bacterium]|nr:hypothetical protein [Acidimicrobiaceae bacterium]
MDRDVDRRHKGRDRHPKGRRLLALAVGIIALAGALNTSVAPVSAAAPDRQLPLVSPLTYLINGLYSQSFSVAAAGWADGSLQVDDLQGVFSLQSQPGNNDRYMTADGPAACPASALACATLGCKDNTIGFPNRCTLTVITDPTRINWYQGSGTPPNGYADLWGTLAHEKTHWAGCGHSTIALESDGLATPTMRNQGGTVDDRTLQQDDINCIRGARLGSNRNVAANGGLGNVRNEWGGFNRTMWQIGGAGVTGPTTGTAWWGSNYGVGGTPGIQMMSGGGATGPVNLHQVLSDIGSDAGHNGWYISRSHRFNSAIYEAGVSPFFANVIVTEGNAQSAVVLANIYCNFVWNGWTTCDSGWFTATTGTYTAAVYNGSQQAGNILAVDNLNVVIQ